MLFQSLSFLCYVPLRKPVHVSVPWCLHLFATVTLVSFTDNCDMQNIIAALFLVILDPKKVWAKVRVLRLNAMVSVRAASQGCRTKKKGDIAWIEGRPGNVWLHLSLFVFLHSFH